MAGIVDMIDPLPQYRDLRGDDPFPNLHLDRGYDSAKTHDLLDLLGFEPHIAVRDSPHRSRPGVGGRSSAPTPGSTATASYAAAPTNARL